MAYTAAELADEVMRVELKVARGEKLTPAEKKVYYYEARRSWCAICGRHKA